MGLEEAIKVTYSEKEKHFEILVKPQEALQYKENKLKDFSQVLFVPEIFKSVSTAERASEHDLKDIFESQDTVKIAEQIFKHGKMELTTEQRRKMVEEKKKQIIALISRRSKDPRTNAPHPPQRIENAMNEVHLNIDPLKPAEDQIKDVVNKIKTKIPLSFEKKVLVIKIPNQFAGKCYDTLRHLSDIREEQWTSDSLFVKIEFPAGMQSEIFDRLNKITSGNIEVKEQK